MERMDPSTSCSTSSWSCSSVRDMWKRSFRPRMVLEPWKHGRWEPGEVQKAKTVLMFLNLWKEDLLKLVVTLLHDLNYLQHFLHVLSGCDQTLQHQHLVVDKHVSIETTHHLKTWKHPVKGVRAAVMAVTAKFCLLKSGSKCQIKVVEFFLIHIWLIIITNIKTVL